MMLLIYLFFKFLKKIQIYFLVIYIRIQMKIIKKEFKNLLKESLLQDIKDVNQ